MVENEVITHMGKHAGVPGLDYFTHAKPLSRPYSAANISLKLQKYSEKLKELSQVAKQNSTRVRPGSLHLKTFDGMSHKPNPNPPHRSTNKHKEHEYSFRDRKQTRLNNLQEGD
jgi:hypothetical protein